MRAPWDGATWVYSSEHVRDYSVIERRLYVLWRQWDISREYADLHTWSPASVGAATYLLEPFEYQKGCKAHSFLLRVKYIMTYLMESNIDERECRREVATFGFWVWLRFFQDSSASVAGPNEVLFAEQYRALAVLYLDLFADFLEKWKCKPRP